MKIPQRAAAVAVAAVLPISLIAGQAAASPDGFGSGSSVASRITAGGVTALPALARAVDSPVAVAAAAPAAEGDCFRLTVRQQNRGVLPKRVVDCAKSHHLEVAKVYRIPKKLAKKKWGAPAVFAWASTKCQVQGVPRYRGTARLTPDFMGVSLLPTAKQWRKGQRWAVCAGASFDSRWRLQRSVGSIKQLAEPRAHCTTTRGRMSECISGTILWKRAFQIYPKAWNAKYPGKKALARRISAKAETYVKEGQTYYVSTPVSKSDWNDGFGRWATVGVPV